MRKEPPSEAYEPSDELDGSDPVDGYPKTTIEAFPPNEVTAGVEVTITDLDDAGMPPMIELHNRFPPEDDQEGGSVYIHGEHAIQQVIAVLAEACAERFDEDPWDDV